MTRVCNAAGPDGRYQAVQLHDLGASQPLFGLTNIVKRVFYAATRVVLPSEASFHINSSFNTVETHASLCLTSHPGPGSIRLPG
jgi:hypothetical protein